MAQVCDPFARPRAGGANLMYFARAGRSPVLRAHHGMDQQTIGGPAYAVARRYRPLLVTRWWGSIGPEYLAAAKQIIRRASRIISAASLLGLPIGGGIC